MLDDKINKAFEELDTLEGESRKEKLEELKLLYQLKQTDTKNDFEHDAQLSKIDSDLEKHESEIELKKEEQKEAKKFKIFEAVMTGIGTIGPMALYGIYLHKGFKFEEDGVFTSKTFSNLIGKLKLK